MTDDNHIPLRDRLRRETAPAHERVDSLFGSSDFGSEQGYVAFLRAQSAAWETLRPILDPGSIARADALAHDLDTLGAAPPPSLDDVTLPANASIGHQYVLEGSRLGSTVLLRELQAKAPALADRASAYLQESAKIDGWKQLSARLQDGRDGGAPAEPIIDDARFMFGLFERAWRATHAAAQG